MFHTHGVHTPDALTQSSYSQDLYFDDISNQMISSQATRRWSRGSSSHPRPSSGAMRVVKPRSANNSPQSSLLANKRRTMMCDTLASRPPHQLMDYVPMLPNMETTPPKGGSTRPMSWHPSSYLQLPQQSFHPQQAASALPTPSSYQASNDYYSAQPQFSPAYSNDTSPSSTFSPLPLFPSHNNNVPYIPSETWEASQWAGTSYTALPGRQNVMGTTQDYLDQPQRVSPPAGRGVDWNTFVSEGFSNTSPPTPEAFSQAQQPQPNVSETSVPYQALTEPEDEGEILVGMGLYDTPEKLEEDPQLDNYRSTVSSLLGSSFHARRPEGRGLKLEETWEPPKSDDEEDDGDDEDDSE